MYISDGSPERERQGKRKGGTGKERTGGQGINYINPRELRNFISAINLQEPVREFDY